MKYNKLGQTDLSVSDLCLGTMTWGSQNSECEGHAQIDMALDAGVNFIDTAEMYPTTPKRAETVGLTEQIVGSWIAESGRRNDIVLATKITGRNDGECRNGEPITGDAVRRALDGSLTRLRTDHVDLYQLHWPNRRSYNFRRNWTFDPSGQDRCETIANMEDVLAQLQREVEAGRIRHVGLSNESAWGMMTWRRLAETGGFPVMQSIQNEYSLLARLFDTDLAEVAAFEGIGLLAYSPLGAGLLTGKYRGGAIPAGSRMSINGNLGGRASERVHPAVEAYAAVARKHGLELVPMALAFCRSRPFMTSAIFGATSTEHVALALKAADLDLSPEVLGDLNTTHKAHPLPY